MKCWQTDADVIRIYFEAFLEFTFFREEKQERLRPGFGKSGSWFETHRQDEFVFWYLKTDKSEMTNLGMSINYTNQLQDIEWRRRPAEPLNKEAVQNNKSETYFRLLRENNSSSRKCWIHNHSSSSIWMNRQTKTNVEVNTWILRIFALQYRNK